jgi:hypothetical protein
MADVEETEELDPGEVDDLDAVPDDLEADLDVDDEPALDDGFSADEEDDNEDEEAAVAAPAPAKAGKGDNRKARGDDEDDDEDDDDEDDDVEADLDTILKDRIAAPPDEAEDEDEVVQVETDDRTDGTGKIQPRKPDEFVCQSCFLVKHPSQLADPDNMFCADCV